jgi:hypothetical protein
VKTAAATVNIPLTEFTREVLPRIARRIEATAEDATARVAWLAEHDLDEYATPMQVLQAVAVTLRAASGKADSE